MSFTVEVIFPTGPAYTVQPTIVIGATGPPGSGGGGTVDAASIAAITHAATAKSPPVDADEIGLADSAAAYGWKKLTWAVIKSTLKTYFDGIYQTTAVTWATLTGKPATFPPTIGSGAAEAVAGNDARLALALDTERHGFVNLTSTSLAFDGTTFTLSAAGTWSYYRAGEKHTITGPKTVDRAAATAGIYYIYIDSTDGELLCSEVNTPWSLDDTKVPVATIAYNSALTPAYWLADERHTSRIDRRMQYYLHTIDGAQLVTAPTITGTLTVGSDANAAKTFGISASAIMDQDMRHDLALLAEPDGTAAAYIVWHRTSASAWAWKSSNMPFAYNSGTGWIQWDNGGTMTDATGGAGGSTRYLNSYLLVTNKTGAARHIIIPGRGIYTTLALAQAESLSAWTWDGFEIDEAVVCYRFTWSTATSTSQGKCRLAATPQPLNLSTVTNASSGAGTDHNTLSNIQGGSASEYYHLTTAQVSLVGSAVQFSDLASATVANAGYAGETGMLNFGTGVDQCSISANGIALGATFSAALLTAMGLSPTSAKTTRAVAILGL